jgi:phytoene dehydrogenase-like protein
MPRVVIIGAGMGGLSAAIRLAQRGCEVCVCEAREESGGLAASFELEGLRFDAGPYILLDRAGLEWAFNQLDLDIGPLQLRRIPQVYEADVEGHTLCVFDSLQQTADEMDRSWCGSGLRYRQFIARMHATYSRLQPLQCGPRPSPWQLLRCGAWRELPFLMQSLSSVLAASRLPVPVTAALGVWTHVAGQPMEQAPAPLALVPAVIHHRGAYYPQAGIGSVQRALFAAAHGLGVEFRFRTPIARIRVARGLAEGVVLVDGEFIPADAVLSDIGLGTYLKLLDEEGLSTIPPQKREELARLPLQSPGVCAYLAVKGRLDPPYLRFRIRNEPNGCRLLVTPSVLDATPSGNGWFPARLIAPMDHAQAESGGEKGQRGFLDRVLAEEWWQSGLDDVRVLATRIPAEWGSGYHLFRNSMNPVMTAAFMRAGRLPHRSPWLRRLYLAGSATHPGQWVSFCAVSGLLAADCLVADLKD